jgi:hypothetical protein
MFFDCQRHFLFLDARKTNNPATRKVCGIDATCRNQTPVQLWLGLQASNSHPVPYFSDSNSPQSPEPPPYFFEHFVVPFSTQTSTCCPKYGWITLKKSFPLMYDTIALSVLSNSQSTKKIETTMAHFCWMQLWCHAKVAQMQHLHMSTLLNTVY